MAGTRAALITSGPPAHLLQAAPEVGHAIQDSHHDDDAGNNGGASYADFNQEYQHIWQYIQHGMSDGPYRRRQAQGL